MGDKINLGINRSVEGRPGLTYSDISTSSLAHQIRWSNLMGHLTQMFQLWVCLLINIPQLSEGRVEILQPRSLSPDIGELSRHDGQDKQSITALIW